MATLNISVSTSLNLTQIEIPPRPPQRVFTFLVITQVARISKGVFDFVEALVLQQNVQPALNLHLSVSSALGISQFAPRHTQYFDLSNALFLTQIGASVNPQYGRNILVISQNAKPSRAVANAFALAQIAHPTLIVNRSDSQALTLVSVAVYFITDAVNSYNIAVPDTTLPVGITYSCGALNLRLKAPELGNIDRIEFLRIQRETRGGDLEIYSDPVWPIIETLVWTFKNISRIDAANTLNFLEQTVGQTIELIDYEGNVWTGIISTPAPDVKCTSDMNCGSYDVTIEYQGVLE